MTSQNQWISTLEDILENKYQTKKPQRIIENYTSLFDYFKQFSAEKAAMDMNGLERCKNQNIAIDFEYPEDASADEITMTMYAKGHAVNLSDSLEILHSTGLKASMENPKRLHLDKQEFWIHRYQIQHSSCRKILFNTNAMRYFESLYLKCWHKQYEIDSFNRLLLSAEIHPYSIQMFRAYAAYLKQLHFTYSDQYIADTLCKNADQVHLLERIFTERFNPAEELPQNIEAVESFHANMQSVESLDHDNILNAYLQLIMATVRTNYFQKAFRSEHILSFKFDSAKIPMMPKPTPLYDLFVYDIRLEGIHLRGGKVARGGIRWSNRPEDYRTEVLGLMKAQMVKNAIIVPTGSKGGFICKQFDPFSSRSHQMQEVEACYRLYINALLGLTDNYEKNKIVHPANTRVWDEDDPYLVVAADKGTAAFSDIANEISAKNKFWLNDAFASGGSYGYDHKKMGITARGAWESVKRHFRVLGKNTQQQAFTVIGIGDMSGDVFGNGMLLSDKIKLIAAFNHLHIFFDPTPDTATSFAERQRMFELPSSSWDSYSKELISQGGGVFSRKSKQIKLTPEIKHILDTQQDSLTPNECINLLLKARTELIWNGGIGTYVKASTESHPEAQDKSNDAIRVNGNELRAKVFVEGGNLGFTQKGRIEYAKSGGAIYTDSIDNSAGVDCSDHEVNIKILLQEITDKGVISLHQRNELLQEMTDEVARLTLLNNYRQTQMIDMMALHAPEKMHEISRYINHLEETGVLNRELEALPDTDEITLRISSNQGLTKPELSILISYSKLIYKNALLSMNSFEDQYYEDLLFQYFPKPIQQYYAEEIKNHRLKNYLISTIVANKIVNRVGIGFGFKMREETGANIAQIIRAYSVVMTLLDLDNIWKSIEALDNKVAENTRYECFLILSGLLQRSISWILRFHPNQDYSTDLINRYQPTVNVLREKIVHLLSGESRHEQIKLKKYLSRQSYPQAISEKLSSTIPLSSAFDIAEIAIGENSPIDATAKLFYKVSDLLDLHWIKENISSLNTRHHWHQLAIANMRNEVHRYQRELTEKLLHSIKNKRHINVAIEQWESKMEYALRRYRQILQELKSARELDFAMMSVAVSEVRILLRHIAYKPPLQD